MVDVIKASLDIGYFLREYIYLLEIMIKTYAYMYRPGWQMIDDKDEPQCLRY